MTIQEKRNQIFSAKRKEESVHVPEWGMDVLVRSMSGSDRAQFMQRSMEKKLGVLEVETVIACTFDPETGAALFTAADRDTLLATEGAALGRIADVAVRLSGLTETAASAAEKN